MTYPLDFAYAFGTPVSTAKFRERPEDFQVVEDLGFEPAGQGEHVLLHIRKRGENTQWLAGLLARFAGVAQRDVGFAGLKDRHAVTSQWFSIYLPKGPEPDWQAFAATTEADIDLLGVARHNRKLRRGDHAANHFTLRLADLKPAPDLKARLERVAQEGVPNYFGEQRFGRDGNNLRLAADWFEHRKPIKPRHVQSMVMSAARSWLFNRVVSERVTLGNWSSLIAGDVLEADGLPTGPLWGRGRTPAQADAAAIENSVVAAWQLWGHGLEHCGLSQERRPLVLRPDNFKWDLGADSLQLQFSLQPGQYATAVLRELALLTTVHGQQS